LPYDARWHLEHTGRQRLTPEREVWLYVTGWSQPVLTQMGRSPVFREEFFWSVISFFIDAKINRTAHQSHMEFIADPIVINVLNYVPELLFGDVWGITLTVSPAHKFPHKRFIALTLVNPLFLQHFYQFICCITYHIRSFVVCV
jgi:hypothetical protein